MYSQNTIIIIIFTPITVPVVGNDFQKRVKFHQLPNVSVLGGALSVLENFINALEFSMIARASPNSLASHPGF